MIKPQEKEANIWRPNDSDVANKVFESGLFVDIAGDGFKNTHLVPFKGFRYDDILQGLVAMFGGGADQNIKAGFKDMSGSGDAAKSDNNDKEEGINNKVTVDVKDETENGIVNVNVWGRNLLAIS